MKNFIFPKDSLFEFLVLNAVFIFVYHLKTAKDGISTKTVSVLLHHTASEFTLEQIPFQLLDSTTVDVDMMIREDNYIKYGQFRYAAILFEKLCYTMYISVGRFFLDNFFFKQGIPALKIDDYDSKKHTIFKILIPSWLSNARPPRWNFMKSVLENRKKKNRRTLVYNKYI